MLLAVYILIFALQVFLLVRCFKSRAGWGKLLILDIASVVLALGCMWYFDTLPGYGIMPGWAYFAEVFYSLCAGAVYVLMTLICILCALLRKKK